MKSRTRIRIEVTTDQFSTLQCALGVYMNKLRKQLRRNTTKLRKLKDCEFRDAHIHWISADVQKYAVGMALMKSFDMATGTYAEPLDKYLEMSGTEYPGCPRGLSR